MISESWHAIGYVSIAALSIGLSMNTNTVIWANYFGRMNLGSIRGFSSTVMVAFSALGAFPLGYIYDRTGSYDYAITLLIVLPILTTIFFYWLHLLPDRLGIRDYIPSEYAQAFMRW